MSASLSSVQNQPVQSDYVVQPGGLSGRPGQGGEIQALEQAVQELLTALQSREGGSIGGSPEQAVQRQLADEQQADQGITGGAPATDDDASAALAPGAAADGGQDAEIQSLEQAVQELLGALQNSQSPTGATSPGPIQSPLASGGGAGALPETSASTPATGSTGTTGSSGTLASDYNNVLSEIAANGNSAQNVQQAVQKFLQDADASGDNSDQSLQQAMNNVLASLQDGTYSQQGSEGALQGAAQRDGLSGVSSVSIAGQAGGSEQAAGVFDSGSNAEGSLGANTAILESEISNGGSAGSQQITDNAAALANEATAAAQAATSNGDTAAASKDQALAAAAGNIANSAHGTGDGSYDAQASLSALQSALPDATSTTATTASKTLANA